MTGEKDLNTLLTSMSPMLIDGEFVFLTFKNASYGDHAELQPIAAFTETEGLTLVVPKSKADSQSLHYDSVMKGITLRVHSSLEAVGLTAAISQKLTAHNISANVIAGFFHDHIFVQSHLGEKAIAALNEFSH